jgi:undecaprenyl diphosphate synthase
LNWNNEITQNDTERQNAIRIAGELPRHIAVIMDGNGRWAVEKNLSRSEGHRQGIETVREIVKASSQIGIKYLTLYAFSLENWKRPSSEVGILMKLLEMYLAKEIDELHRNNVRFTTIGRLSSLPKAIQKLVITSTEKTKNNTGLNLILALSYSGRWDIVRAVQMIALDVRRGKVSPEDINEEFFAGQLQTSGVPDPDLMIRTSGEMRLSNFLLWEMAYGEMYICDKYWPDFSREDLYQAIENYTGRERRFGKTSAQILNDDDNENKKFSIQRVINAIKNK